MSLRVLQNHITEPCWKSPCGNCNYLDDSQLLPEFSTPSLRLAPIASFSAFVVLTASIGRRFRLSQEEDACTRQVLEELYRPC